MAGNPGIFIRSQTQDFHQIISACKQFLNNLECRAMIKGLVSDGKYGGHKLYFSEDTAVTHFLKEKYLPLPSEQASIHSLTTSLVVHDIIPESVDDFKQVLRVQMEKMNLKPIIRIDSIPISPEHSDIQSGNWLVELDIPEIEDLDIFKHNGLPHDMTLTLMLKKNAFNQENMVTHCCSLCNSTYHSRLHCSTLGNFSSDQTEVKQSPPKFEIRERTQYNAASSSKSAKTHRIEAIASDLERKKKIQSNLCNITIKQETDNAFPIREELKQEFEHEQFPRRDPPMGSKRKNETDDINNSKKRCITLLNLSDDDEGSTFDTNATASSTTGKDTPKTSIEHMSTFSTNFRTPQNLPSDSEDSEEDETSLPNLPTSSQPETSFSTDQMRKEACDSDSNDTAKKPKYTRRKPTYAPVVLPHRIKQIVLSKDLKEGELNVGQLEAFFNHVKKKMCPAKIAERYTSNVEYLRNQLNTIIKEYYHTPKAGSGEDSRFMKWLEGMLARFDATPTVRKKARSENIA